MLEGESNHFLACDCGDNSHIVKFTYLPPRKNCWEEELWVETQLPPVNSFWKRFKLAIKYLFGRYTKNYWGFWNTTLCSRKRALELRDFLNEHFKDEKLVGNDLGE